MFTVLAGGYPAKLAVGNCITGAGPSSGLLKLLIQFGAACFIPYDFLLFLVLLVFIPFEVCEYNSV